MGVEWEKYRWVEYQWTELETNQVRGDFNDRLFRLLEEWNWCEWEKCIEILIWNLYKLASETQEDSYANEMIFKVISILDGSLITVYNEPFWKTFEEKQQWFIVFLWALHTHIKNYENKKDYKYWRFLNYLIDQVKLLYSVSNNEIKAKLKKFAQILNKDAPNWVVYVNNI